MSFTVKHAPKFSPKAKGWAACVAVGAAATVATVATPQKAQAFEWWTPPSNQTLTWRNTGYTGETVNLIPYSNPIGQTTGSLIFTQTGSSGTHNVHGVYTYSTTTHASETTTAPFFAQQSPAGFNLLNSGYDGPNMTGTSSAWWVKISFIDRQNADNSWPAIGLESWDTWNRYFFIGVGYAKAGLGTNWVTESGTDITAGPWGGTGYTQNSAPTSSSEMGLIALIGDGANDTVSFQTSNNQNQNATNAGATDMGIPYADRVARVNGAEASVRIGKLEDGTLEITWEYDGVTYPTYANTFWTGTNDLSLDFFVLGYRYATGSVTFTDFEFGGGYTTQVPEPASLGLLGIGGMLVLARRRKA